MTWIWVLVAIAVAAYSFSEKEEVVEEDTDMMNAITARFLKD